MEIEHLPGSDLVAKGLDDARHGVESVEALLVFIGAERLRAVGIDLPERTIGFPEDLLYALLAAEDSDSAHGRYNALVRRLVSFERAAESTR